MSMKTVTVKQVAEALNLTTRAVRDRLARGDLRGTQKMNSYGVKEWRIYPTKEIAQKLNLDEESSVQDNDFPALEETVDAEMVQFEGAEVSPHQAWVEEERHNMRMIAEEMMKPLLTTIRDQERQIEDQTRQLKLLPDFQKQAENDRQMAIAKAMEAEALSKQVEALKVASEEAEAAKSRVIELEEEKQLANEKIEELKLSKSAEILALEKQLSDLAESVQEMKKPWWKKMFSAGSAETTDETSS